MTSMTLNEKGVNVLRNVSECIVLILYQCVAQVIHIVETNMWENKTTKLVDLVWQHRTGKSNDLIDLNKVFNSITKIAHSQKTDYIQHDLGG